MKKALTIGGISLLVLIVALGIGFYVLLQNVDSIVKAAVERVGSDVTGTEVTLGKVELSLTEGRGSLLGFRMTNPEGFSPDDAFRFDEVTVKIDLASVTSDPVVINEVLILNPVINYEIGDKDSNLDQIQRNVETYSAAEKSSETEAGGEKAPGIIIETLIMRGAKAKVVATRFPDNVMSADLPEIRLRDIGKAEGGATPAAIAEQLMTEMIAGVSSAISSIDISKITDNLGENVKKALGSVDSSAAEEGAAKAGESLGGAAEEAGEALKGLLGTGSD